LDGESNVKLTNGTGRVLGEKNQAYSIYYVHAGLGGNDLGAMVAG